jgi:hypothetical protein
MMCVRGSQLPGCLAESLRAAAATSLHPAGIAARPAPAWGEKIFSDCCVLVSPTADSHVAAFVQYAVRASPPVLC